MPKQATSVVLSEQEEQGLLQITRRHRSEQQVDCLDPECVIIESYGPTYRGVAQVGRWVETRLGGKGNQVSRWDVTSFYVTGDTCFFEWAFECTYEGNPGGFEGASIAHFKNGKIILMREYAMTAKRYEWEG